MSMAEAAELVRETRHRLGLTQAQLAQKLEVSYQDTVGKIFVNTENPCITVERPQPKFPKTAPF